MGVDGRWEPSLSFNLVSDNHYGEQNEPVGDTVKLRYNILFVPDVRLFSGRSARVTFYFPFSNEVTYKTRLK